MIDILLIAVIVILIIAIAVLFGLKYLQSQKGKKPNIIPNKQPKIKRADPRLALSDSDEPTNLGVPTMNAPKASTPPETKPVDELAYAEYYLRNQDYNSAIGELKRVLMTNPRHTGAMLRLLQVYGVTKQYETFNQLHQKIREIADSKTVQEADFCKSLIDDELAQQAAAEAAKPVAIKEEVNIEVLEFTTEDAENNNIEPQYEPQIATSSPENALIEELEEEFDLDFDFDTPITQQTPQTTEPKPNVQPVSQTAEPEASFDTLLDVDFDAPIATSPQTKPAATNPVADESLEFGLNELDFSTPADTTSTKTAQTNDNNSLDLDVGNLDLDSGLGLDASTPAKPVSLDDSKELELDSFDFNLDNDVNAISSPTTANTNESNFDDLEFDLKLDDNDAPAQTKVAPVKNTNDDLGDFDDFSLEASNSAVDTTTLTDTSAKDDSPSLDFDTPAQAVKSDTDFNAPATKQSTEESFSFDGLSLDLDDLSTTKTDNPKADDSLSFDDLSLDTQSSKDTNSQDDLSLDGLSLGSDLTDKNQSLDNDFKGLDFDFGLEGAQKPVAEVVAQTVTETSLDLDDLTFDLEDKTEPAQEAKPQEVKPQETVTDSDFDFGDLSFDASDKTEAKTETAIPVHIDTVVSEPAEVATETTKADSNGLDFDFSFDDTPSTKADVVPIEPATSQATADDFAFDLGDLSLDTDSTAKADEPVSVAVSTPQVAPVALDMTDNLEATNLENVATTEPVPVEPQVVAPVITAEPVKTAEIVESVAAPEAVVLTSDTAPVAPVITPVTPQVAEVETENSDQAFSDSLDNAQITLNLAKQYMAFGEYSSAKHLLGEVLQTGSDSQKQNAQTLISRLS